MTIKNHKQLNFKNLLIAGIMLFLFCYLLIQIFSKKSVIDLPVPKVVVQRPKLAPITNYVIQTGTLVAYNSVDLVARVEGYLQAIEFVDGTYVKTDQEVFIIQPEPYMEKWKEAKAEVTIARAELAYAKSEYARQQKMYTQHATSLNNVEKWMAKAEQTEAAVAKAVANEQLQAITYSYTHVHAPFEGRIGRHLVSIGNLVGNGVATNLATLEQIDKLYVYFNLNELDLLALREAARKANMDREDIHKQNITVDIALQTDDDFKHHATMNFVNTGINASTGTMELRALLDNSNRYFVPGLFVQVRIPLNKAEMQLTVPETAILSDQIGYYVFTVDKDKTVQLKRVTLGAKNKALRAVLSGLHKDDRVIVQGLQNATPGTKVEVVLS